MKNAVQLIAYADRLGGDLRGLAALLEGRLAGLFGGVHILPFYRPIDGSDAGFDPIDHAEVDDRIGSWSDVAALGAHTDVMADVIVNHISSRSPQFVDFLRNGDASVYAGMFLTFDRVFPAGASERDLLAIYRPRPGLPFTALTLAGGRSRLLWTTFTAEQIDVDVTHPHGIEYLENILRTLAANGVKMVRLDAIGYAIKQAGTSCFMTPATFEFIEAFARRARGHGLEVLVEIHSYYRRQLEIARQVDCVYDFALPPLVLHALFHGTARALRRWIEIRPVNAVTVLDTHDGIGIIDIGGEGQGDERQPGLVPDDELASVVDRIHANSNGESRRASGAAASNLDLYQVNCTFYDALGRDDRQYLLARAIQFFVPGVPQVYYVGLLAGCNDMALLERTAVGRDINRHYYTIEEIDEALGQRVVVAQLELIRLRSTHAAFQGEFECVQADDERVLRLRWSNDDAFARLDVDFGARTGTLEYSGDGGTREFDFG